jgi:glycosyltransferase involved in cell wall biosynthesis
MWAPGDLRRTFAGRVGHGSGRGRPPRGPPLGYRDHAELGEIVGMLADDPALCERLGVAGRAFVAKTYTWPRIVERYLDLFAEVRVRSAA